MQALMHRTDHDGLMAVRAFLQHAVQMILLPQRLKQRHAAGKTDFANAPIAALGAQQPIGQQRLMRAVERAEAKVHDAAAQGPAVIVRLPDGARQRGVGDRFHLISKTGKTACGPLAPS